MDLPVVTPCPKLRNPTLKLPGTWLRCQVNSHQVKQGMSWLRLLSFSPGLREGLPGGRRGQWQVWVGELLSPHFPSAVPAQGVPLLTQ